MPLFTERLAQAVHCSTSVYISSVPEAMDLDDVNIGMGTEATHSYVQALMKGEGAMGSQQWRWESGRDPGWY